MAAESSSAAGGGRFGLAMAVALFAAMVLALPRTGEALELLETFDATSGGDSGLRGMLLDGRDEPWQGRFDDGAYVLSNSSSPNAVKFFHFGSKRGARPTLVAVEVSGDFEGENSGAGLLYRYDGATGFYFAFVVAKNGHYALYKRTAGGFRPLLAGTAEAIAGDGPNHLRVELDGPTATLFVNDQKIGAHKSVGPPDGLEAGMIAISSGTFSFDDFQLVTE
jgi:hypothetical protein